MERRAGFDFDGIIHDSITNAYAAFSQTRRFHGLDIVPVETLKLHFGSDWHAFFDGVGIPEALYGRWKDDYQRHYDAYGNGDIIPDAREVILELMEKIGQGNIVLVTNEKTDRVRRFLHAHDLLILQDRIYNAHGSKAQLLEELGVTDYIGDIVSDGKACIAARNKPRFIGVAHKYGYNMPQALFEFKEQHPEHEIVIVPSISDVLALF
jgi:phosphoglycolate phosphatase-like HAD superfamily hydrolase